MAFSGSVVIDGQLVPPEGASVSAFDRGFLFGDSVFEVMRTYGGVAFCGARHLRRLTRSCQRVLIAPPTEAVVREDVERAIASAAPEDCVLRIVVTRGEGPVNLDPTTATRPRRLVYALPLRLLPPEAYQEGVGVRLVHAGRGADAARDMGAKSSNYLTSLLATHEVRSAGAHEALLVGPLGEILEGATSNVFLVRGGVLCTPPVRSGLLEGITRALVLELARGHGIEVRQAPSFPSDLYTADEAFITSSVRGVVPVTRADGWPVGTGRPGPLTRQLLKAYGALTRQATWNL